MRLRRWVFRGVLGVLALLLVAVALALFALAHLDSAPMKGIVTGQARKRGVALDFDQASVTWGGLALRNVRVLSPAADAALAPVLVQIGRIDGRWTPLSKRVDELVVGDVTVTLVVDDDGTTSLDRFLAGLPPSPPTPATPLSRLLEGLLPQGLAARARLENVTVALVPRGQARPIKLEGLAAEAVLAGGQLTVKTGPADLRLTLGDHAAAARLDASVEVEPQRLAARVSVTLDRQDLVADLPAVKEVFALAATVTFAPAERRTRVQLERLALADGALGVTATVDLLDGDDGRARPVIVSAAGKVDLAALARAAPPALGPVTIEAEPLTFTAKDLALDPAPRGELALAGRVARLVYRDVEVRGLGVDVQVRPDGDRVHAVLRLPVERATLPGLTVTDLDAKLDADGGRTGLPARLGGEVTIGAVATPTQGAAGVKLVFSGAAQSRTAVELTAKGDVARVHGPAALEGVHVELGTEQLVLGAVAAESTGTVKLLARLDRVAHPSARAGGVDVALAAHLGGKEPSSATVKLDAERLELTGLPSGPAHLELDVPKLVPDLSVPARSRAEATLAAAFAGTSLRGSVAGSADDVSWDLAAKLAELGPVRGLSVASKGRMAAQLEQDTTLDFGRVATAAASLRGGKLHLVSTGTRRHQELQVSAALDGVVVRGAAAGSPRFDATAAVDLDRPRVELRLKGSAPAATLHLIGELDAARALRWEADGQVAGLGALAALLPPGTDWDRVAIELRGRGVISGVVKTVQDGVPVLVASPATAARGRQALTLGVRNVHMILANERRADLDALTIKADVDLAPTRTATIDVSVPALAAVASGVHLAVEGLTAHLDATVDPRNAGALDLVVKAEGVKQSAFASYPLRDAELAVHVKGDPATVVSLEATFANPGAGTRVQVAGAVDRRVRPEGDAVPGRQSFWLAGSVDQVLDALAGAPDVLRASGQVSVPFRVESGDLELFHTSARVKLDGVSLELPGKQLRVTGLSGEVPITQELLYGPGGPVPVGRGERGLYPQLRFADHQPFLGAADYLTLGELRVGERAVGPLAANVRLDRDVLALDQLEMTALGGKISGQCLIVVAGDDTSLTFRGKVTGLRPSSGDERLDANAALTLTPYRYGLEGRVELVTIGKGHLRDLLDVYDPYRADPAANKARLALTIGYPEQVRLHFSHGFASIALELGGLAGAVTIDPIPAIPIGPVLAKYLAPYLEKVK